MGIAPGNVEAQILAVPRLRTANWTLTGDDNGGFDRAEGSSALIVTVPPTLPAGFSRVVFQYGIGVVTPTAGSGATKLGSGSTTAQNAFTTITVVRNADGNSAEFVLSGGA